MFFLGCLGVMGIVWLAALVYFGFNLNALGEFVDSPLWQGLGVLVVAGIVIPAFLMMIRGK